MTALRPFKERTYDPTQLVVAKPGLLGGGYVAGQRFRPDRSAINKRRVRQFFDQRILVTDEEWQRFSGQPVGEPAASLEPVQDAPATEGEDTHDLSEMTRQELMSELRKFGVTFGPNSKRETLEDKLREALEG